MMNNAKILKITLNDINFKFNIDKKDSLQLKIQTESRILPPKNKYDKTALFIIEASITDTSDENIKIDIISNIIFEFDNIPEDYDEVAKDLCIPLAQNAVFEKVDDILEIMGYPKFNIISH